MKTYKIQWEKMLGKKSLGKRISYTDGEVIEKYFLKFRVS
jgi:hypothetical protein